MRHRRSFSGTTSDGVVEQQSALPQFSPDDIVDRQLECDPGAIGFVGPLVNH